MRLGITSMHSSQTSSTGLSTRCSGWSTRVKIWNHNHYQRNNLPRNNDFIQSIIIIANTTTSSYSIIYFWDVCTPVHFASIYNATKAFNNWLITDTGYWQLKFYELHPSLCSACKCSPMWPLNLRDGGRIRAIRRGAGAKEGLFSRVDRHECKSLKIYQIRAFFFFPSMPRIVRKRVPRRHCDIGEPLYNELLCDASLVSH